MLAQAAVASVAAGSDGAELEPGCIEQGELQTEELAGGAADIARGARGGVHDGAAAQPLGAPCPGAEAVKQRAFTHIGATKDDQRGVGRQLHNPSLWLEKPKKARIYGWVGNTC